MKQRRFNNLIIPLVLTLLSTHSASGAERKGMTWGVNRYNADLDISRVHCYGQVGPNRGPCDPYQGDTPCSVALPVLCLKIDGSTRPPYELAHCPSCAMNDEYYNGWAEGTVELTEPVPGNTFANLSDVNAYCEAQLGAGYRVAEHHDGRQVSGMDQNHFYDSTWPLTTSSGGWGFYAPGQIPDSRFWVYINDQNANCWGGYRVPKGSIGDQVWADPDSDGNGLLDGDDYPLSGIVLHLYDSNDNPVRTTSTFANGKYVFSHLDYGTYTVEVDQTTLPSNMQGNIAYDSDGGDDGRSIASIDASKPNNKVHDFAFSESLNSTLTVNSTGGSGVPVAADPSNYGDITDYVKENIPEDTEITLTAPAESGSMVFDSWVGCDSTDAAARTCTVTMSENKTVTADYIEEGNAVAVNTTGVILIRNYREDRDAALFRMTGMTDIGTVAKAAAGGGTPLTFRFGPEDDTAIYSFTADSFKAAGNRLIYRDTDGNMLRCVFSGKRCVVRIRHTDLDGDALDALLTGEMTVSLEFGGTRYTDTGRWTQFNSGSGRWTKYRKNRRKGN